MSTHLLVPIPPSTVALFAPPPPPPDPSRRQWAMIAAVMERAVALLHHGRRWTQGSYKTMIRPSEPAYCLVGAVSTAAEEIAPEVHGPRRTPLGLRALAETVNVDLHVSSIEHWNDEPGRTAEQVIAALRATAERARSNAGLPSAMEAPPEIKKITRRLVAEWQAAHDVAPLGAADRPVTLDVIAGEETAQRRELTPA